MTRRDVTDSPRIMAVAAILTFGGVPAVLGVLQLLAQPAVPVEQPLASLRGVPVPEPPNLHEFVRDRGAAVLLGKALFWDAQAGSGGQACASCHFHAGADTRTKNQLSPGLANEAGPPVSETFDPVGSGGKGGPNYTVKKGDFPTHRLADPADRNSAVLFDSDDVVSSQGVFHAQFVSIHGSTETCDEVLDLFHVRGHQVRRVEPRNTPTVINAAFNFRNFWDGRANNAFNGVDPFGPRNPDARVLEVQADGSVIPVAINLPNSSLASQAVGPPLSGFESSCSGRLFTHLGEKLLRVRPLESQIVDPLDSVLARERSGTGKGLRSTYAHYVRQAFQPRYWSAGDAQMKANFSLYWGLAIQLYESTLISDQTRFDSFMEGNSGALTAREKNGLAVFTGKGKCANCHNGPELTAAATHLQAEAQEEGLVERMLMGDGNPALYDNGFYNIGVRPSSEDLGVGRTDPFGNPLSFTRQVKDIAAGRNAPDPIQADPATFEVNAGVPVDPAERDAVDGSFKTPGLRNVELTGPYFHNGGQATLEQVVEFYDRGGDRRGPDGADSTGFGANGSNLDPDIGSLGLTAQEKADLVAFLKTLTDERVRWERAPFDHPQLFIPDGHPGDENNVQVDGTGKARDSLRQLPAVGAPGRGAKLLPPLAPFKPN